MASYPWGRIDGDFDVCRPGDMDMSRLSTIVIVEATGTELP